MTFFSDMVHNEILMAPFWAWVIAQILKTLIHMWVTKSFVPERMIGDGGMPSSHSALVCSLFVGTARLEGLSSPLFAIAFVLAAIVMYDAMGVRLETGKQAQVLNRLMKDLKEPETKELRLKEMVGHTPFQVLSGALLGVLLAVLIPVFE